MILDADSELPATLPFPETFKRVLQKVIDDDYPLIKLAYNMKKFQTAEEQDDLQTDLANAIGETILVLGFEDTETGDWTGILYTYAADLGYDFSRTS